MPEVLDWQRADQPEVVRRAVQALSEGRLVVFPTETAYHLTASALLGGAVEELTGQASTGEDRPLMLAVGGAAQALDWAPDLSPLARRLARRCWPGPVALRVGEGVERGLACRLPESVRRQLCPGGELHLHAPGHDALLRTLDRFPGPLVTAALHPGPGSTAATRAEEVIESAGESVALVIDGGPSAYDQPATVVRVNGDSWGVVRPGVVAEATLTQLAPCTIVFVCTGNTCRSPLAEALCKKMLAQRLGCGVDELPQRGYRVLSAGLSAMAGDVAATEAVEVARELGTDLSGHVSQRLTHDLLAQADYLLPMTRSHLRALVPYCAADGAQPRLLASDESDIPDPIGGDREVYRACALQIAGYLEEFLGKLVGNKVSRPNTGEASSSTTAG
ncbi:MAG: Sua5/YciO/YrdC/YwlC family protein [Gemmataceae bacterium]|nr:Sua5/YciO/YrdC/YwlC family protein [Gemmataceae bacterium]